MPALDRSVKVTCGNCGTSVTKKHLSRHKSSCSGGTLYFTKCPSFSTKLRDDLNYHIANKHATPPLNNTHKCKICFKVFSGFYALRQHKTSEHGLQMKSAELDVYRKKIRKILFSQRKETNGNNTFARLYR